ncbi:MAG TPA: flagellar export chaperone FliS, partial [Acidobacteriaceae bacterium]|nr:flagellar export chaperone FliS [Acidobacteriaceae bacterium]
MNPTELAYRKTAVEGASGFGLLIALYDTLVGNLRRAADAQRKNDIPTRCHEINHALLVIGYLEDWIDRENGGELARKLVAFYTNLRATLIEAQARKSAEVLEREMAVILAIRGTWQDLELRAYSALESPSSPEPPKYPGSSVAQGERSVSSWSA